MAESAGSSTHSWDDAVMDAVRQAKGAAPRPIVAEVAKLWADIGDGGRIERYRASVRVAYHQPVVRSKRS